MFKSTMNIKVMGQRSRQYS